MFYPIILWNCIISFTKSEFETSPSVFKNDKKEITFVIKQYSIEYIKYICDKVRILLGVFYVWYIFKVIRKGRYFVYSVCWNYFYKVLRCHNSHLDFILSLFNFRPVASVWISRSRPRSFGVASRLHLKRYVSFELSLCHGCFYLFSFFTN